jgi:hypothetical protein
MVIVGPLRGWSLSVTAERLDIADPTLRMSFAVVGALDECRVHGDGDVTWPRGTLLR